MSPFRSVLRGAATLTATLTAALLAACGRDDSGWSVETDTGSAAVVTQGAGSAWPPFFAALQTAPYQTAFTGTRRVVLHRDGTTFDYIENVGADGTGRFAVEVPLVNTLPPELDPVLAAPLLAQRGRFGYRLRDPQVTDLGLLALNWDVQVIARDARVAGHTCWRLELRRRTPLTVHDVVYELAVDPRTGLVLAWRESDLAGVVRSEVEYSTLQYGGDTSGMDLRERDVAAVDLDLAQDLAQQVGAPVHVPTLAPPGFNLEEVELLSVPPAVTGGALDEWVKVVFTDGLERVHFLHRVDRTLSAPQAQPGALDLVTFGSWTFGLGTVNGVRVMAAGKVPSLYLEELVQTAVF